MRLARATSSAAVSRRYLPASFMNRVSESVEPGRRTLLGLGPVGFGRDDGDLAGDELRAQRRQLLVLELVLDGECLQRGLLDRAPVFGVIEEVFDQGRKHRGAQLRSLLR